MKIRGRAGIIALLFSSSVFAATNLTTAIHQQSQRSLQLMLNNISRPDAAVGSVVAAPSKVEPNYYFNWIRDAALTMHVIEKLYAKDGPNHLHYEQMLKNYVQFSRENQLTPNLSGAPDAGGLGEPKFNMDGSAFNGAWGRPQNDGPALRAITLIAFANNLLAEGQANYVRQELYDGLLPSQTVIKVDLEYVAHHWGDVCFDLWEEVRGHHFFTLMVSRRALLEGAKLAQTLGDGGAAQYYSEQASAIAFYLQQFWDAKQGTLIETIGQTSGVSKSGLDVAIILGALHGETADGYIGPASDWVMATAARLINAFQALYAINKSLNGLAPAIGRYPEDIYDGVGISQGNPWFLATLAFAEYCYRLRSIYARDHYINVTQVNASFLRYALYSSGIQGLNLRSGIVANDSRLYSALQAGLANLGDRFFRTVLHYGGADGSLSEEFNRNTGVMTGAPNLTWSHAAFLTAASSRAIIDKPGSR